MRLWVSIFFLLLLSSLPMLGQSGKTTITGYVQDSTGEGLEGATTVLLRAADSVLVAFAMAGKEGRFILPRIAPGKYLLQITYVGYGSFQRLLDVAGSNPDLDLGKINLGLSGINLEEVTVREEFVPILIKDDTIEYNAGAYKTTPNATVEDLLKQMPGIEIDQDGNIKAQGEEVKQVLVDGKEFFGKDPKVATKNLPADAVEKVQVFDKKSEEAEFTGIDDGKEEKAMNLKLKEDKKKGVFGTAEAAYGPPDLYRGKFNLNRFGEGLQISALGLGNNLNEQGFSFGDYMDFTGGGVTFSGSPGRFTLGSIGIPLSFGGSDGVGRTFAGGLNFNFDFGEKTKFRSFYFYNNVHHVLEKEVSRTTILEDGSFNTYSDESSTTDNTGHHAEAKFEHDFDSTHNIVLNGSIDWNDTRLNHSGTEQSLLRDLVLQNEAHQQYTSEGSGMSWNTDLVYRKKFRKKGRNMTLRGALGNRLNDAEGELLSTVQFFDDQGIPASSDTTNQFQRTDADNPEYNIRFTYTEPLARSHYLQVSANRNNYQRNNQKSFFDLKPEPEINEDLSSHFEQTYRADAVGLQYRIDEDKLRLTAGAVFQHSLLRGEILNLDTTISKAYNYLLPSIWGEYSFTKTKSLSLYYNAEVNEPDLDQLQPVVTNNDPLRIYEGNPNLQPEYEHYMTLRYRVVDQFNFRSFFGMASLGYTVNPIVSVTTVDSLLRQVITSANASRSWSLGNYLSYSTPIKPIKVSIRLSQYGSYSQSPYFINGDQDEVHRLNNTLSASIENRKKETVEVSVGARWSYTDVQYAVNDQLNQSYQDYSLFADLQINFPLDIILESTFDRKSYSQEAFGEATVLSMWDASLSKGFWDNRLTVEFAVEDILNQNIGLERNADRNYIEEIRTNTLGRYFLIGLTYKLTKIGGGSGGIRIIRD